MPGDWNRHFCGNWYCLGSDLQHGMTLIICINHCTAAYFVHCTCATEALDAVHHDQPGLERLVQVSSPISHRHFF